MSFFGLEIGHRIVSRQCLLLKLNSRPPTNCQSHLFYIFFSYGEIVSVNVIETNLSRLWVSFENKNWEMIFEKVTRGVDLIFLEKF